MSHHLRLGGIPCILILLIALFAVVFQEAEAQFFNQDTSTKLSLSPRYPAPQSKVTVSLDAYAVDATGATIRWFVDGSELGGMQNERSITVETGALGEDTEIEARIVYLSGLAATIHTTITPTIVDLIIEADTVTPMFYKGRKLPSSESAIRIVALTHTGGNTDINNLSYKWELNGKVLFGGPVKGKHTIDMVMPTFDNIPLTVEVSGTDGMLSQKTIFLRHTSPELHFYTDNPLRGMSRKAVHDTFAFAGEEVTVRAEPYFVSSDTLSGGQVEWVVDGNRASVSADPLLLTLRKSGGSGTSNIDFRIINAQKILQGIAGSFRISF